MGKKLKGVIFHTDRGCQYTSAAFRKELAENDMIQSLNGVGHCYDNARMESFFATLKKELIYPIAAYRLSREEVKTLVFKYVFVYYNRIRVYTFNPMGLPPVRYRECAEAIASPRRLDAVPACRVRTCFPPFRYAPVNRLAFRRPDFLGAF